MLTKLIVIGMPLTEIWNCMAGVKFIFSNICSPDLKKKEAEEDDGLYLQKSKKNRGHKKENEKKKIPLFYTPKIRPPKYEYY